MFFKFLHPLTTEKRQTTNDAQSASFVWTQRKQEAWFNTVNNHQLTPKKNKHKKPNNTKRLAILNLPISGCTS